MSVNVGKIAHDFLRMTFHIQVMGAYSNDEKYAFKISGKHLNARSSPGGSSLNQR